MAHKAKVVGILSIKGGVGKTTTVVNLAYELAHSYAQRVLVVDADLSNPNVGLHVGFTKYSNSVHDALRAPSKVTKCVYAHEFGFHVMPGSLQMKNVKPSMLKKTLQPLKKFYDYILVDSSPNLNEETIAVMSASDELYVVSTPDTPTLTATLRAARVAKEKKVNIAGVIMNQVRGRKHEFSVSEMESLSKLPVVGVVNDNSNVLKALSSVTPFTKMFPQSDTAQEFRELAGLVCGAPFRSRSKWEKMMGDLHEDYHKFASNKFARNFAYYK